MAVLLEPSRDGTQPVTDGGCPIPGLRIAFGGRTVFGGTERAPTEQGRRVAAAGAHGPAGIRTATTTATARRISSTATVNQPPGMEAPLATIRYRSSSIQL